MPASTRVGTGPSRSATASAAPASAAGRGASVSASSPRGINATPGRSLDREPVQRVGGCARPGLEPVGDAGARLGAEPEDRGLIAAEIDQAGAAAAGEHDRAGGGEHGRAGATLR